MLTRTVGLETRLIFDKASSSGEVGALCSLWSARRRVEVLGHHILWYYIQNRLALCVRVKHRVLAMAGGLHSQSKGAGKGHTFDVEGFMRWTVAVMFVSLANCDGKNKLLDDNHAQLAAPRPGVVTFIPVPDWSGFFKVYLFITLLLNCLVNILLLYDLNWIWRQPPSLGTNKSNSSTK